MKFNCDEQHSRTWEERALLAARYLRKISPRIPSPVRIADLGCGNERLRAILERPPVDPFTYQGFDVQPQSPSTRPLDLQQGLPDEEFDVVFCLGLLEYIDDLDLFFSRLARVSRFVIFSYVTSDAGTYTSDQRLSKDWRHDFSSSDIEAKLKAHGFRILDTKAFDKKGQRMWVAASRYRQKPRIAHIYLDLPVGGAEDISASIQEDLAASHDVSILCLRKLDALGEELRLAGRPVECLPVVKGKRISIGAFRSLRDWLVRNGIEVVHTHVYHAHLYGVIAARMAGIKTVMHHHKTFQRTKLRRLLIMRRLSRLADMHVALSEQTRLDIVAHMKVAPAKTVTLPNAVNPGVFHPAADRSALRTSLGLPADGPLVGTAASLNPQKNHGFSAAMMAGIAPSHPDVRFLLLGDGPLRDELQQEIRRLHLGDNFLMPGKKRPLHPWLQALDVFVLISTWEGESLALLQALACGLPVVATAIEGNVSILGENHPGLIPAGSLPDYIATMRRILDDPSFVRGILAYQEDKLPPRQTYRQYLDSIAGIYDKLLAD